VVSPLGQPSPVQLGKNPPTARPQILSRGFHIEFFHPALQTTFVSTHILSTNLYSRSTRCYASFSQSLFLNLPFYLLWCCPRSKPLSSTFEHRRQLPPRVETFPYLTILPSVSLHTMKTSIALSLLALAARVLAATPPGCLLNAVNTQDDPTDLSSICGSDATDVQEVIASICPSGAVSAAQSAFIATCSGAGSSVGT
jgi:hypothetical protein